MARVRTKYAKYCAHDIGEVRKTMRETVRKAAEEWAKKPATEKGATPMERFKRWVEFLREKLSEAMAKLPITCTP